VDRVQFPYRSSTHLTLLHVVSESGAWEKHGLDVDYDRYISSSEAHRSVPNGDVEFVGGNHVSTYAYRARGDKWVYLGQTVNYVDSHLVVRADSDINSIGDLKGKKVGTRGSHPSLNDWLRLKKNGLDIDRDDVELINQLKHDKKAMDPTRKVDPEALTMPKVWEWVRDRVVDGAFITPPSAQFAHQAGLKLIEIEPMPMIWHTTISSNLTFVEKYPDIAERLLKGLIEGIHFFKTQPEATIDILHRRYTQEGKMIREIAAATYAATAPLLEPKLFPSMAAISNVYQEALRQDEDAKGVNPLELWDTHFLRRIVDSGFVSDLYGKLPTRHDHAVGSHTHHHHAGDAGACEACED
jgi:ABC-type nitrate/sulfonate/bicarbonate transport system substrate-binding protein